MGQPLRERARRLAAPPSPEEEQELVRRVRSGDVHAFEVIYRSYVTALDGYATHYVRSRAQAEDVVQEVFLRLWQGRESWQPRTGLGNYLFGAVRNGAISTLRRAAVEARHRDRFVGVAQAPALGSPPQGAQERLEQEELVAAMANALEQLPPQAQAVARMRWHDQASYAEIAVARGLSVKTVDNYMVRSIRLMRTLLARHRP